MNTNADENALRKAVKDRLAKYIDERKIERGSTRYMATYFFQWTHIVFSLLTYILLEKESPYAVIIWGISHRQGH